MIRSICAVLAGIVVLTAASFTVEGVVDPLLLRTFPQALPNTSAIAFNPYASLVTLLYTSLCVAAGGYVTAWIAGRAPVQHAVVMGAIEVVLTAIAMFHFRGTAPLRMWVATLILTIPVAWIGGALRAKHSAARTA